VPKLFSRQFVTGHQPAAIRAVDRPGPEVTIRYGVRQWFRWEVVMKLVLHSFDEALTQFFEIACEGAGRSELETQQSLSK